MKMTYHPRGVCASQFTIEVEDHIIRSLQVVGGCKGNLQGISALLAGMKVTDAIERLEGIRCGLKKTSCPNEIAQALKTTLAEQG